MMITMHDKLIFMQAPGEMDYIHEAIWLTDMEGKVEHTIPASYFRKMDLVNPLYQYFWMSAYTVIRPSEEDFLFYSLSNSRAVCDTTYHYYPAINRLVPAVMMKNPKIENGGNYGQEETPSFYTAFFTERETGPIKLDGYMDRITKRVMVDKHTLRGSAIHLCVDKLGMIDITAEYALTFSGEFALNLPPDRLQQLIEERLNNGNLENDDLLKLRTLYDSIDDDDNNYVIVGKLK